MKSTHCAFEEQIIQSLLFGELSVELSDHLSHCEGCKEASAMISRIAAIQATLPPPSAETIWLRHQLTNPSRRLSSALASVYAFERAALWLSCLTLTIIGVVVFGISAGKAPFGTLIPASVLVAFVMTAIAVTLKTLIAGDGWPDSRSSSMRTPR